MTGPGARHGTPCAPAGIDFDRAQAIVAAEAQALEAERVSLVDAGGRTLAGAIHARIDAPRFDCAAMDGFALRSTDIAHGVRQFRCRNSVYAGERPSAVPVGPGEASRIMTGAPMPLGADRVVMMEQCEIEGDFVFIRGEPGGKAHVRLKGSDFRLGYPLLAVGQRLTAAALVAAAAADIGTVPVIRMPRILLLATGDEIVSSGSAAQSDFAVPDSISTALSWLGRWAGGQPVATYCCSDDRSAIGRTVAEAQDSTDIIVVIGGASNGDRDFARSALLPFGLELRFAGVKMKPGKPLWYGRLGTTHILGLPGNPTAALTTARLFLVPLIAALAGRTFASELVWRSVPSRLPVPPAGSREAFLGALEADNMVELLDRQEASLQSPLGRLTSLVRRPAGAPAMPIGTMLQVLHV